MVGTVLKFRMYHDGDFTELFLLGCSPSALIELTSTPEEGNRASQAVPEVFCTEWLCIVWCIVCVLMLQSGHVLDVSGCNLFL